MFNSLNRRTIMDAVEFKTLIETTLGDKAKDALEFHQGLVALERDKGIQEVSKRNREAESLRKYKLAFEGLGYNPEQDLSEFVSTVKSTKEVATQKEMDLKGLSEQFTILQSNFNNIQKELTTERTQAQELRTKAKNEKLKSTLTQSLADKVYGSDFIVSDLVNSGKVDLVEDKVVFVNDDKTTKPYEDGLKSLLDSRPDIVKSTQNPGGSTVPGGSGQALTDDQARLARLRKLSSGGII